MSFAQPGWLVLLILLPLIGIWALLASRLRKQQWEAFVAPRLRSALLKRGSSLPRWLALFFLLTACAAMIIALARPQADSGIRTEKTMGRNVLIALDLSRSMRVSDVKPDRLAQAKVVIYELLEAMPNERIGLIGFAGDAYLYAPLTVDHDAVRETVAQVDETWAPKGGSDLASAVHLATETLKKTGQKNNALVILSDGEKHEGNLDAMIAEAEKAGVYILAVGVGTEDGGFVPNADFPNGQMVDQSGKPVVSRLQADVMRKLAAETKGRFTLAGSGLDIPEMVKSVVKDLDAFEMKGRDRRLSIEFYQWLLFPAILFLMVSITIGTRWKAVKLAILLASGVFMPGETQASDASHAKAALTEKNYEEARKSYHQLAETSQAPDQATRYRLGEATAAYRSGDFRSARTAFSQSLLSSDKEIQASAHLGMGNSLFQLGWQGLAAEAYPSSPAALPDLNRFDTLVKEMLAKIRESETPEGGNTNGYVRVESLITNWVDAVKHFKSARVSAPADQVAHQNQEMTLAYLKRLRELLEEEKKETEEAMPQPQQGQGEPQQGRGDPGEGDPNEKEGPQDGEKKPGGKKNGESKEQPDKKNGDKPDQKDGKGGKKDPKESDSKNGEKDPNESPEDRARRILKENADLEKGPLTPGRYEIPNPKEDW